MAPKSKSTNVYIVVSSAGIDSVHAEFDTAQGYAIAAKQSGQTSVRTEVYSVIRSLNQPAAVAAAATATASSSSSQPPPPPVEAKKTSAASGSSTTASSATIPVVPGATPAKVRSEAKSKDAKAKEPKSETKPKETKPKESKSDAKGKTKDDGKGKPEPAATEAASESGSTSALLATSPTKAATTTTPSSKTIPAEDQRAINAKKGTKPALEDLPANIQSLLSNTSDTLSGLTVVVTGIPPTLGRKNAEKLVENHGGKLGKSITGKTNLVVLGNDAGPKKLEQISELKIVTIDEDALVRKLEANGASASSSSRKRTAEDGLVKKAAKKVKE